jgi:predicted DNA-binding protein (UPF0251 family)
MAEQMKFQVVAGRKPVARAAESVQAARTLREATTGQVITLSRVWAVAAEAPAKTPEASARPAVPAAELGFYRKYTEALLRRYVQMTMEAGRVPSMMGREVLGGRASSYRIHGFDDAVIFRLDVERCLKQLTVDERAIIRRVAVQEHTQGEAAGLLGISLRTCVTRYGQALDRLTGILLRTKLLEPLKGCQGVDASRRPVSR